MPIDLRALRNHPDWFKGKRNPLMVKHPGNKNKKQYNTIMREGARLAGTTGLDDPASGPAGFLQGLLPQGEVNLNEWDKGLTNLLDHVQQTPGGLDIPFSSMFEGQQMNKPKWMDEVRGATIQRINRGEEPKEGSLNHYIWMINNGIELDAAQKLGFAQAYYMNKKTGLQGGVRPSKEGGYNNNTAGDLRPFKQPDLNLLDFQSLFENANIRQGDAGEALNEWDINRKNLLASDPPYEGEPSTYSNNYDQMRYLRALLERHEEGQPIIAFDSAASNAMYEDMGLDTHTIIRPDNSAAKAKHRGDKLEMVATNIDGFDPIKTLRQHGHERFIPKSNEQSKLGEWVSEKSKDPFETSWDSLVKGIDIDFSEFPKAKERNMFFGDMLEEIPRTEEEELSEVQMDEKGDPCCEEAYSKYNQLLRECYSGAKPKPLESWNFSWEQGNACDSFRGALERNSGTKPEQWTEQGWIKFQEGKAKILAEWDACASNADWHDIAASADPFKTAWDSITKKGKFKGYSRSNISDRPYRQGKAKAWGIGRKVKRERTQKRYKRNQARGNFRPAMRRQLGAGGTRASSNR